MTSALTAILSVLGASLGAAGLVTAWVAGRAWRRRCSLLETSLAAMRRELDLITSSSAKTGLRVNRIEHEYAGVAERVDWVEQRGSDQVLEQAIEQARRGADAGKLSQQFGLSRGEAELIARMHGAMKSA